MGFGDFLKSALPAAASFIPGVGPAVSAGLGIAGGLMAGGQERGAANAGLAAMRQYIPPELEEGLLRSARMGGGALKRFNRYNKGGLEQMEARELERLRSMRAPDIAQARSQLQSRLLSRGRLGVGVGGGRTGAQYNPETAALEEAILNSQLGDIGAARSMATAESGRLLNNATGLFNIANPLVEQANPYAGQFAAMPGMNEAATTRNFFGGLANAAAGWELPSASRQPHPGMPPSTFGGGLRNSSGGYFL